MGWISVHQYPKQNEFLYFVLILLGLPVTIYLVWWLSGLRSVNLTSVSYEIDPEFTLNTSMQPKWTNTTIGLLTGVYRLLVYVAMPVLIYFLTYNSWIHGDIDLFHEGERLAPLNEMLRGKIPYRDIYLQHGLFQNACLPLSAAILFSPTLEGVRRLEHILDPLGYVAIYLLAIQVFGRRRPIYPSVLFAGLTVLLVSAHDINNFSYEQMWVSARHGLGLFSLSLTTNYLNHQQRSGIFAGWQPPPEEYGHRSTTSRTRMFPILFGWIFGWRLILAGFFSALTFWYSTEIGLYTIGTTGLFLMLYSLQPGQLLSRRPLPLACYGSGILLGILPVFVCCVWHHALDDLIVNNYIQTRYQIETGD